MSFYIFQNLNHFLFILLTWWFFSKTQIEERTKLEQEEERYWREYSKYKRELLMAEDDFRSLDCQVRNSVLLRNGSNMGWQCKRIQIMKVLCQLSLSVQIYSRLAMLKLKWRSFERLVYSMPHFIFGTQDILQQLMVLGKVTFVSILIF